MSKVLGDVKEKERTEETGCGSSVQDLSAGIFAG
jgi:hypothetical protein